MPRTITRRIRKFASRDGKKQPKQQRRKSWFELIRERKCKSK